MHLQGLSNVVKLSRHVTSFELWNSMLKQIERKNHVKVITQPVLQTQQGQNNFLSKQFGKYH